MKKPFQVGERVSIYCGTTRYRGAINEISCAGHVRLLHSSI